MEQTIGNIQSDIISMVVKVNDKPLDDAIAIGSVKVVHQIFNISTLELTLIGDPAVEDNTAFIDEGQIGPGAKIDVLIGRQSEQETPIFSGIVVKVGMDVSTTTGVVFKILAKHLAVKMTFKRTDGEFAGITDSAIMASIIGNYPGLQATVDPTVPVQENMLQLHATDWDFLVSRCQFYGYIITMDSDTLFLGNPKLGTKPVLTLKLGQTILDFNAELNAETQIPSIKSAAWDINTQALSTVDAFEPKMNQQGSISAQQLSTKLGQTSLNLSTTTAMGQDELNSWANGALIRNRMASIKGVVKYQGNATAKTGDLIELEGVGSLFNGNAFVSGITHVIAKGIWETTANFGLDTRCLGQTNELTYPMANGMLPAVHGLQAATVMKICDDPQQQYRILVNVPTKASTQTGLWARLSTFAASNGSGSFFIPEVGDEVIVGFMDNDPRFPVIVGSVYSSSHKPDYEILSNNNIKAITTREKMKISFDEDKKVIKIETPGNNSITIDDANKCISIADDNRNLIKMSANGIEITSDKDVNISAQNINLKSKGNVAVDAATDVAVKGLNVALTATIGMAAKSMGVAEFSASGHNTIKGAMVMIN